MATYVYDKARDRMVNKATGEPMVSGAGEIAAPQIFSDLPGYTSPIDGSWIEGRRARRYDMEKNGCVDANDFSSGPKKLKNKRFAKKHGAEHLLEQ